VIRCDYDEDLRRHVLVAVAEDGRMERWPVGVWEHDDQEPLRQRRARLDFENRWCLSVIWHGATYSSNHDYHGPLPGWRETESQPFIEQPGAVEIGILIPEPLTMPSTIDADTADVMVNRYPGLHPDPDEAKQWLLADREVVLWGDPLGYVNAEGLAAVAHATAGLPSHPSRAVLVEPEPEFYDVAGFLATVRERFGGPLTRE
jgi:hypothetical protein